MSWDMSTPRVLSPGDRIDVIELDEYPVVDWNGSPWTDPDHGKPILPGRYEIQMIVKRLDRPPRVYCERCGCNVKISCLCAKGCPEHADRPAFNVRRHRRVPSYQLVLVSADGPVLRRRIKVSPNKQLRRVVEGVQS